MIKQWSVAVALASLVIAVGPAVGRADAELICRKKKGQLIARTACKAKETPLDLASLLAHTRSLYFTSGSLQFSDTMDDPFTRGDLGLVVAPHPMLSNGSPPPAVLMLRRPLDYDGTSPVVVYLYLVFPGGPHATDNAVRFRIKSFGVDIGDWLVNAGWEDADAAVTVTDGYQVLRQAFTLDAEDSSKEFWYLQFGRGDVLNGHNYPDSIVIAGVEIQYTAVQ